MGIFDADEKAQRKNIQEMMKRNKNERILSLYDSLSYFKMEPLKNSITYCRYASTAGFLAYINNAWCVTFINNTMTRYKTDSIAPICQKRTITSPRALVQYIIDMEKETNVFFATDQLDIIEEMKKLPLTFSQDNNENISFDFELFKIPLVSDGRLDFYLNDNFSTLGIDVKLLRAGRPLKLFFQNNNLYIKDALTNTVFDMIATDSLTLNQDEKNSIEKLDLSSSGRVFQGVLDGHNIFTGSVIIPGYEFGLINKMTSIKINKILENKNI